MNMKIFFKIFGAGVLVFAIVLVAFVAVTWAPDRSVEDLKARWAQPPSQFIEADGMRVHVRDEGSRDDVTPIVLLHGTAASLHTWEGWEQKLKGQHRVISLDLPGFGLTGPYPDGDYTIAHYVRFLTKLLDRLGVRRFVLAGNSFGGLIAWQTALTIPERVRALVLIDAGGYPQQSQSIPIGFVIANTPLLNQIAGKILPRAMIESSVREVYGDPNKVTPDLVDRYYELTLREGNRQALAQRFKQVRAGQNAERIRDIIVPTLILWGGRDRLLPPENAQWFRRDIRQSQMVIFDALGHVPHEEDPAATVDAVNRFLAALK